MTTQARHNLPKPRPGRWHRYIAPVSAPMLPVSAILSSWLGSVLTGHAPLDGLLESLQVTGPEQTVVGLEDEPLTLVLAVGRLRRLGASGCSLALPAPGDPAGLAGPSAFNERALEAGQAVVVTGSGLGLVPESSPHGITWRAQGGQEPPPPDLSQAGSDLRRQLMETTQRLVELDVARWRPEIADVLSDLRRDSAALLPPNFGARRVETVDRAMLCREVVGLAVEHEGGAVTAAEIEARRLALVPLDRAARHALVAACSV